MSQQPGDALLTPVTQSAKEIVLGCIHAAGNASNTLWNLSTKLCQKR